jgi:hypothetical protein
MGLGGGGGGVVLERRELHLTNSDDRGGFPAT